MSECAAESMTVSEYVCKLTKARRRELTDGKPVSRSDVLPPSFQL